MRNIESRGWLAHKWGTLYGHVLPFAVDCKLSTVDLALA
jgi:hypothetical protein